MNRWERFDTRDRAYSRWHRRQHDSLAMFDVDAVEYCGLCLQPILLIETARDVGQPVTSKDCRPLISLARKAKTRSALVFYKRNETDDDCRSFRVASLWPTRSSRDIVLTPSQYETFLKAYRDDHAGECSHRTTKRRRPNDHQRES